MSERSPFVRGLPCIACELFKVRFQPLPTEEHHLNLGGKAGQARRGDEFSIPLCQWHHQGHIPKDRKGKNITDTRVMAALYGPSLKLQSKRFREVFGTDDHLLGLTNEKLRAA